LGRFILWILNDQSVSIVEAVACGCYPFCPNKLVFPEYLPEEALYNTTSQLEKKLRYGCKYPDKLREWVCNVDFEKFHWKTIGKKLDAVLRSNRSKEGI
jgi:hypothetical protein